MRNKPFPTNDILNAFEAKDPPVSIPGGQGQNYRSGNVILKPAQDDEETNWIAEFYLTVEAEDFRLPRPLRTQAGGFVYKGWQAWEYIEGQHKKDCWEEVVKICVRFHRAIADHPQPAYFERREQNPWVVADKIT